jgi:serine protease Do
MKTSRLRTYIILAIMIGTVFFILPRTPAAETGPGINKTEGFESSNKLEAYFQEAKQKIEEKDLKQAAFLVRQGAQLIKKEIGQSQKKAKDSLLVSVQRLERLADDLDKGVDTSMERIRKEFSSVHQAMAEYYSGKVTESLLNKTYSHVSEDLNEAVRYLEMAWVWSGRRMEMETKDVIRSVKDLGKKISEGAEDFSGEISQAVTNVNTETKKLHTLARDEIPKTIKVMSLLSPETSGFGVTLAGAVIHVAKTAIPAVVQVEVTERREVPNPFYPYEDNPFFRKFFQLPENMPKKFKEELRGLGTGMIINADGYILTNNHVVAGATEIKVLMADGQEYSAKVIGTDPKTDLGVIKISADKPLPYVIFGDSDNVQVGQWVIAIGHPRGLDQTVTQGIISAKHRTGITDPSGYQDFLQTDAAINPGNSGGPLLTIAGQVIGVNSAIATQSGGFEGIGFAIPSRMAVHIANALIQNGRVERGWLGVSIQELSPDLAQSFHLDKKTGALIADVMKGGPADIAGLQRGDVVLEYRGAKIDNAAELRNRVADTPVGESVILMIWRDSKKMEVSVKIGNLEDLRDKLVSSLKKRLGVTVGPVTYEEAANYGLQSPVGVRIQWVDKNGPLGKVGFEEKDLILGISDRPINDLDTFLNIINSLPQHQKVVLLALDHRSGETNYVQVEIN